MTVTVRVEARAWGAKVETNGETVELGAHQDRAFQVGEGQSQSFTVTHGEKPVDRAAQLADEEVPGRRQNDELLGQNSQPGTTEATATPDPTPSRGRGRGGAEV